MGATVSNKRTVRQYYAVDCEMAGEESKRITIPSLRGSLQSKKYVLVVTAQFDTVSTVSEIAFHKPTLLDTEIRVLSCSAPLHALGNIEA